MEIPSFGNARREIDVFDMLWLLCMFRLYWASSACLACTDSTPII